MALVVLGDVVLQVIGEDLIGNGDGGGSGEIDLPGLAIGFVPGEVFASGSDGAEALNVRRVIFDVVGAWGPIRDGEFCGRAFEVRGVDRHVHQMRVGAFEGQFVLQRRGRGSGAGPLQMKPLKMARGTEMRSLATKRHEKIRMEHRFTFEMIRIYFGLATFRLNSGRFRFEAVAAGYRPQDDERGDELGGDAAGGVDQHVGKGRAAAGHERSGEIRRVRRSRRR